MNVLLIYPEFPDTFWSFKHAIKFIRKKAAFPPLGLLTIGAMLPKAWSKRLVDVNVTRLSDEDLAWADYAFISGMAVQRASAHQIIERCKNAGLKIVAGGPLFTSDYEQFNDVDHFGGRVTALWNINDNWSLTAGIIHQDTDSKGRPEHDPVAAGDLKVIRFLPEQELDFQNWTQ